MHFLGLECRPEYERRTWGLDLIWKDWLWAKIWNFGATNDRFDRRARLWNQIWYFGLLPIYLETSHPDRKDSESFPLTLMHDCIENPIQPSQVMM